MGDVLTKQESISRPALSGFALCSHSNPNSTQLELELKEKTSRVQRLQTNISLQRTGTYFFSCVVHALNRPPRSRPPPDATGLFLKRSDHNWPSSALRRKKIRHEHLYRVDSSTLEVQGTGTEMPCSPSTTRKIPITQSDGHIVTQHAVIEHFFAQTTHIRETGL